MYYFSSILHSLLPFERQFIGILNPYYKYIAHLQRTLTDLRTHNPSLISKSALRTLKTTPCITHTHQALNPQTEAKKYQIHKTIKHTSNIISNTLKFNNVLDILTASLNSFNRNTLFNSTIINFDIKFELRMMSQTMFETMFETMSNFDTVSDLKFVKILTLF